MTGPNGTAPAYPDERAAFVDIVKRAIRGEATDAEREWLMGNDVVDDFRMEVIETKDAIEGQLLTRAAALNQLHQDCLRDGANRKGEYFQAKADHDAWRAGAVRVSRSCQSWLTDIRQAMRNHGGAEPRPTGVPTNREMLDAMDAKLDAILATLERMRATPVTDVSL